MLAGSVLADTDGTSRGFRAKGFRVGSALNHMTHARGEDLIVHDALHLRPSESVRHSI